jgi:hypothetical protein
MGQLGSWLSLSLVFRVFRLLRRRATRIAPTAAAAIANAEP